MACKSQLEILEKKRKGDYLLYLIYAWVVLLSNMIIIIVMF